MEKKGGQILSFQLVDCYGNLKGITNDYKAAVALMRLYRVYGILVKIKVILDDSLEVKR